MKENACSITAVAARTHLKSKTTVVRILQGQAAWQSCDTFFKMFSRYTQLDEKWTQRFRAALRTERIGLRQAALLDVLSQQLLLPEPNVQVPPAGAPTAVLILGCPWQETYEYIEKCFSQNANITICHYMTPDELYDNPPVLAGLLTYLTEKRYQAFLIEKGALSDAQFSWNIMLQLRKGIEEEYIAIKELSSSFSWYPITHTEKQFAAYQSKLSGLSMKPLFKNEDLHKGPDYVRLLKESLEMETAQSKTLLKPTPGVQMLPADLAIQACRDFLNGNIIPIVPSADAIYYYHRRRAENFYNRETQMIISHQAMTEFVHSGRLADQFYACRPFTPTERLQALRYLLEKMEQPQVTVLFSKKELNRRFTIESYSRFGALIYPSQTSYNSESDAYRELILPGEAYAKLFRQFTDEMIIPEYCHSALETKRLINRLIVLCCDLFG